MGGLEVEEVEPAAPRVRRRRRRAHRVGRAASRRRSPARVRRSTSAGEPLIDRVRRAERRGRHDCAPVALEGATLPGGLAIKRATMRGVESQRHAVLGEGARARRGRERPARRSTSLAPGTPICATRSPRRHADHAQAHAQPRRLPVDARASRATSRRSPARRSTAASRRRRRSTFDGVASRAHRGRRRRARASAAA